ncbi:hypothetical protein ABPG77_003626 [Micractinium sp. CCAP 211/92]
MTIATSARLAFKPATVLQTMNLRVALLLAASACLVSSASAALPSKPFKNPGGPPFLNGPSYHFNETTQEIVTMGITYEGNYSFAYTDGGEVHTELGVYTSWECGPEPGSYLAIVELTSVDIEGNIIKQATACEFGYVFNDLMKNTWSQSEEECPTETTEVNIFLGDRPEKNSCGTPAPDYTIGDSPVGGAPAPAARRMLQR